MSGQKSSCSKLHPERQPGPCIHCNCNKDRYIHLAQKKNSDVKFYEYVEKTFKYSVSACICRGCELQIVRFLAKKQTFLILIACQ